MKITRQNVREILSQIRNMEPEAIKYFADESFLLEALDTGRGHIRDHRALANVMRMMQRQGEVESAQTGVGIGIGWRLVQD